MNLLEGGKGGEGRVGERGWGGDGGRVGGKTGQVGERGKMMICISVKNDHYFASISVPYMLTCACATYQ